MVHLNMESQPHFVYIYIVYIYIYYKYCIDYMACKPHKGRAPVATSLTSQHVTGCGFDDSPAGLCRHGVLAAKFAALRRHAQGRARGSAGAQRSAWDVHWDWVKCWNGRYGLIWSYIHDPSRDRDFYGKSLENYCYNIVCIPPYPRS